MNPDQTPAEETPATIQPVEAAPVAAPAHYESNPFKLIKPSIAAFKLCWANVILATLALIGIFLAVVILYAIGSFLHLGPIFNVLLFIVGAIMVLYMPMALSWMITKAILGAVRGEKLPFKSTLPARWTDPLKLLWTSIVAGFLILIGLVVFVVPGIIAMAFWSYAPIVTVDSGEWGWAALKKSRDIMRGRAWDTLGAMYVISVFGLIMLIPFLGTLVYLIFVIITAPVVYIRYQSLLELKSQPDWHGVPTNKWNYVVLVLGLLVGGLQNVASFDQIQKNSSPVENINKAY